MLSIASLNLLFWAALVMSQPSNLQGWGPLGCQPEGYYVRASCRQPV
jgi:hypothetical protein